MHVTRNRNLCQQGTSDGSGIWSAIITSWAPPTTPYTGYLDSHYSIIFIFQVQMLHSVTLSQPGICFIWVHSFFTASRVSSYRRLQFLFHSCIMVFHWLLRKLYKRPFLCDFLLRSTFSWENDFRVEFSHFKERNPLWKWVFHYDPGHAPLLKFLRKYDVVFFDVIRNICFWTGWHLADRMVNGVLKVSQVLLPEKRCVKNSEKIVICGQQ